jgi:hypothetical protein
MNYPPALLWPNTPVPNTTEWMQRCLERMLHLDPALDRVEAHDVADDMSQSAHWRHMPPEQAAETLFLPIGAHALPW